MAKEPSVIWYHRLKDNWETYLPSLKLVLESDFVTHVKIVARALTDPPHDAVDQAQHLAELIRAAGKEVVWDRWFWACWPSPPHAIALAHSRLWVEDQVLQIKAEAAKLGGESSVDFEPYTRSLLHPLRWQTVSPEWAGVMRAWPLPQVDYAKPASFSPDRESLSFYGLFQELGVSRIGAHTYWRDSPNDPRLSYEVFGACLGRSHPRAWSVKDLLASRVWPRAQGLFLYALQPDVMWAAEQLRTCSRPST